MLIKPEKFKISSDYHLRHKNVLKYDNRPFTNIEEHDEQLIKNHNSVVKKDDDFFFLGDFCFDHKYSTIDWFLSRLNGNKYFIKGNHDKKDTIKLYERHGIYLGEQCSSLKIGNDYSSAQTIILNHFKMMVWDKSHHGSWHLYGHSHGNIEHVINGKSMDVGIMQNNYFPFDFFQIEKLIKNRSIKVYDHHGKKENQK